MKIASFENDFTDAHRLMIELLLPTNGRLGRPRTPLRAVVDAIFYLIDSGCPWQLLPRYFRPWKTGYHFFWKRSRGPFLGSLNARFQASIRESEGYRCRPTAVALDSQTVCSEAHGGAVGFDPGKRTEERKPFLLADTRGMILGADVVPSNETERVGTKFLLKPLLGLFSLLRNGWVDSGYC